MAQIEANQRLSSAVAVEAAPRGCNVTLDIYIVRHGEKDACGNLQKSAYTHAVDLGKEIGRAFSGDVTEVMIEHGTKERVRMTANALANGIAQTTGTSVIPTESADLSHAVFMLSPNSSYFQRVNRRLNDAERWPMERRKRIENAEKQNLAEWIGHDNVRPDETTASPQEVARDMVAKIASLIDGVSNMPSGTNRVEILVTHEYMLAAMIRYLLASNAETGQDIFQALTRIEYLEQLVFHIRTDDTGEGYMTATLRGNEYVVQLDQSHGLHPV